MPETTVVGLKSPDQAGTRPVPSDLPPNATVHDALKELINNYHDINPHFVTELSHEPSALEFMRFVARNQPFVIRNNISLTQIPSFTSPLQTWNAAYLTSRMQSHSVTVALTPAGNADAVVHLPSSGGSLFCKPHEVNEPFFQALSSIRAQEKSQNSTGATRYIQSQNDNLRSEYTSLFADIPPSIPWASSALDSAPDAINFWLGNSHSTSVLHKDHYENLFMQIRGAKDFVLLPPVESACVNERAVLSATYTPRNADLPSSELTRQDLVIKVDEPEEYVPLPTWDPDNPEEHQTEYSNYARPLRVRVREGDMLYLPRLWYHKVKQIAGAEGLCCSVNYWYDMDFSGPFQCTNKFVQDVAGLRTGESE